MPAENDDKMTNSDENDAYNEQNSTRFDTNCTQKEVTDISAHSIKPFRAFRAFSYLCYPTPADFEKRLDPHDNGREGENQ
jgi:hypothetical protein